MEKPSKSGNYCDNIIVSNPFFWNMMGFGDSESNLRRLLESHTASGNALKPLDSFAALNTLDYTAGEHENDFLDQLLDQQHAQPAQTFELGASTEPSAIAAGFGPPQPSAHVQSSGSNGNNTNNDLDDFDDDDADFNSSYVPQQYTSDHYRSMHQARGSNAGSRQNSISVSNGLASPGFVPASPSVGTIQPGSYSLGKSLPSRNSRQGSISGSLAKSYGSQLGSSLNNLISPQSSYGGLLDSSYGSSYKDDYLNSPLDTPLVKTNSITSPSSVNPKNSLNKDSKLSRRRELHNAVERRRRDLIKDKIKELGTLIPPPLLMDASKAKPTVSSAKDVKANKSTILNKSVEYIAHLQYVLKAQDAQLAQLEEDLRNFGLSDQAINDNDDDGAAAAANTNNNTTNNDNSNNTAATAENFNSVPEAQQANGHTVANPAASNGYNNTDSSNIMSMNSIANLAGMNLPDPLADLEFLEMGKHKDPANLDNFI